MTRSWIIVTFPICFFLSYFIADMIPHQIGKTILTAI